MGTVKHLHKQLIQAALAVLLAAACVNAAPPKNLAFLKDKPEGFRTDWTLTRGQLEKLKVSGAIRKAGRKGIASPTTYKVLVIRVEFSDSAMFTTAANAEAFFVKVRNYYYENSYGLITVTATVTNNGTGLTKAYILSGISNYNHETEADLEKLLSDSKIAAEAALYDFSQYDHVMIYHAGNGEEESGAYADLWSVFYPLEYTVAGKTFLGFTVVPEITLNPSNSPLAVICHEYGHQLGLFDLYDTSVSGGASTCGTWSLMDYAYGFDNTGANPPMIDPWSKNYLQWIDLSANTINSVTPSATLGDTETSQTTGYFKIPIEVGTDQEYFIVEFRRADSNKMLYDLTQPATGVIIWHVDDTIALDAIRQENNTLNTGSPNLGIDLVEKDGKDRTLETGLATAKVGDMWQTGDTFTSPMSNAFNGRSTGISLANFSFSSNGSVSFSITKLASAAALSTIKTINYPNPAGAGYYHPKNSSGILTTLAFHFSRPPREVYLHIYNLAGELVRTIAGVAYFTLKVGASSDYKWVYEYDWDGKNNFNEDVAPGVYFYRVKADTEIKVGKMAIVR
ncbi:MAG: M6 family metalloprotease domain-containing protein [Elusimicrobiota bacterium]